jgi:UDP-galactopyranose mutase
LAVDFFKDDLPKYKKLIYTGPIDKFYNYKFGELEYKTTFFNHKKIEISDYQGTAVMNFTSDDIKYTRIVEHKHFEDTSSDVTWITEEYPEEYNVKTSEPMYPVNDDLNNSKYQKYKELTIKENDVYFGGRLAEYKYYDMHQVIESALNFIKKI